MTNIPTKEEVIEIAQIHPLKVKNIYLFGSRVYGTARDNSDYDFILVGSALLAKDEKKSPKINVHIHTTDTFRDELMRHDIHNLECFFAPEWATLLVKEPFKEFQLNKNKLKQSVLSESWSSWHKAKMSIQDGNIYRGIKSLWHSLRMLQFGIDIAKNGRITQWDVANQMWFDELRDCEEYEWSYFKEKYFAYKQSLEEQLKGI
jgi:predicted nucleotidyltransferase